MAENKYIIVSTPIIDYTTHTLTSTTFDLENQVNRKIKEGYSPLGGPCYVEKPSQHGSLLFLAQAMIKND